jgi:hypothetical protein
MSGRRSWIASALSCLYRIRLSAFIKFLLASSFIVWGSVYMYYKGENDYNMFYVAGQCLWKSYGNLENYVKSGREFQCVTDILQLSSDSHGGFFDVNFPTDKVDGLPLHLFFFGHFVCIFYSCHFLFR